MLQSDDLVSVQDAGMPREKIIEALDRARAPYSTPGGKEVLVDMMIEAGLFSRIEPTDQALIGARNFMIYQLERMGILDRSIIMEALKIAMSRYPALRDDGVAENI